MMDSRILAQGTSFVWKNARLLERAVFEYVFCDGASARILTALGVSSFGRKYTTCFRLKYTTRFRLKYTTRSSGRLPPLTG